MYTSLEEILNVPGNPLKGPEITTCASEQYLIESEEYYEKMFQIEFNVSDYPKLAGAS